MLLNRLSIGIILVVNHSVYFKPILPPWNKGLLHGGNKAIECHVFLLQHVLCESEGVLTPRITYILLNIVFSQTRISDSLYIRLLAVSL